MHKYQAATTFRKRQCRSLVVSILGEKECLISFSVVKREAIHNFFFCDGDDVCDLSYKTPAVRTLNTCLYPLPLNPVDMINLLVLCRCGVEEENSLRRCRVLEINQGSFCCLKENNLIVEQKNIAKLYGVMFLVC